MISKELFCKTIADIQEQDRKISEFDHALGKICDSAVVFDADNLYLAALLRILKEELDDKADTIEWWLYEGVCQVRLHAFVRNRYYRCWGASCERVC